VLEIVGFTEVIDRLWVYSPNEGNLDVILDRIYLCIIEARQRIELITKCLRVHPYRLILKRLFTWGLRRFPFLILIFCVYNRVVLWFNAWFICPLFLVRQDWSMMLECRPLNIEQGNIQAKAVTLVSPNDYESAYR
jgi:hypothetical protein